MTAAVPIEPRGLDYLGLLKVELIGHVRRARGALGVGGVPELAVCADAIQQVQGVLRTLGLERLTLLAEELAKVTRTLDGHPPDRREDRAVHKGGWAVREDKQVLRARWADLQAHPDRCGDRVGVRSSLLNSRKP